MNRKGRRSKGPRRQWGADSRAPLPAVPPPASSRSIGLGRIAAIVTVAAWLVFAFTTLRRAFFGDVHHDLRFMVESVTYVAIVTLLTGSALVYLLTRLGHLYRTREHRRVPRAVIDELFAERRPTMTVLVPAYREEAPVVRKTLLSVALQEYPALNIVLLIDDPPNPISPAHRELLAAAEALPGEIAALLAGPSAGFRSALEEFESQLALGKEPGLADMTGLAADYEHAATWLEDLAAAEDSPDHVDRFFADQVLRRLGGELALMATAVRAAADDGVVLPTERLLQLRRRLVWTFHAELSSFQRKLYTSLSSEPNKAMNLNSYLSLMGGAYKDESTGLGRVLRPCHWTVSDVAIANPDYVLTLDADSVLLAEYCLRLVYLLEQPENERIAVTQTPYSSYPGSATRLERIAGATTDIQHNLHQGLAHYDATFWVGANAILRKAALDDIATTDREGGWAVRRYIADRTVIEDTESSIDLGMRGWTLANYPERLSYSATPPDFGSLCIQRQRWANGGLLILPKLWRHFRQQRSRGERIRFREVWLRTNYMASIAWATVALILLLTMPYNGILVSPFVFLAALPYFVAMADDLKLCGYKRLDVLRIYGFNLVLVPVNLVGVLQSIMQAMTGQKIPFARTPKVNNRTPAALSFVIIPYLLVLFSAVSLARAVPREQWGNAIFAGLNATLASYAIVAFIGLRNSAADIWANVSFRLSRPVHAGVAVEAAAEEEKLDWATVLHYGTADPPPQSPPAPSLEPDVKPRRHRHLVPVPDEEPLAADAVAHAQGVPPAS